jgi:hypothetical protein
MSLAAGLVFLLLVGLWCGWGALLNPALRLRNQLKVGWTAAPQFSINLSRSKPMWMPTSVVEDRFGLL